VPNSDSSLTLKTTVNHQVVLQLVELWCAVAKEEQNQLIKEDTLLKLVNVNDLVIQNQQLETESFFLLISSGFDAFLRLEPIVAYQKYEVIITLDSEIIVQELIQLGNQNKWEKTVIQYVQTELSSQLNFSRNHSDEFIVKVVKLLISDEDKDEYNHIFYPHPPMDKLLHYQVEQERIFEQIKIQISQNLNLSEIIQTAIKHSCDFLKLDRLLVYQLDVALDANHSSSHPVQTLDTVTYEAKQASVDSTLYFQEEICWHQLRECKNKYEQGSGLIINDLEQGSDLNPCLKSLMRKFQVKAKAVTPINVRGKLWGLVIAHQCFKPRHWQHQDIRFLRQISEYLAIAIYHHQSYEQLQQQKILLERQVQTQAQQIKDALIAAEAASKSKHEFLGSMSHELRTPLTCVIGLSSTLLQWSSTKSAVPLSPEKQQQYLHLIQQSGKHLLALINNILEFSDVESGKHLLDVKQISLVDITKQSWQILQETAKEKKIALRVEINLAPDQEYFFADEIRLKEILYNLLSNGIKFTPEYGEVILRVWREKRQVVFQIEDTGIGIATEEIPMLFEKFKQIENFKDRTHGGTGLGLALTKKLVELHGGNMEVESALGQGSLFTVYLPTQIPFNPLLTHESTLANQLPTGSPTIMLVTEDEESATFICQLLNTIDCQVVWLMDLVMAMDQIELLQPKLVIVDRDFDAAEVNNIAKAIKKSDLINSIKLVLLENGLNNQQSPQFSQFGVPHYLNKSMNPTQMINQIITLLQEKKPSLSLEEQQI
jgi:two-component system, sensor histidine kinase and response regulator